MGTGYRPEKKFWVPMGTGYRPEKNSGYRRVPGTGKKKILGTDGYRVPGKFSLMPTPVRNNNILRNHILIINSNCHLKSILKLRYRLDYDSTMPFLRNLFSKIFEEFSKARFQLIFKNGKPLFDNLWPCLRRWSALTVRQSRSVSLYRVPYCISRIMSRTFAVIVPIVIMSSFKSNCQTHSPFSPKMGLQNKIW